jgi:hypothetical protein
MVEGPISTAFWPLRGFQKSWLPNPIPGGTEVTKIYTAHVDFSAFSGQFFLALSYR